ncbi:MAG: serine hydrolase [Bacteroidota bacterium]
MKRLNMILLLLLLIYSFAGAQPGADSLLNFIINNKSRSALYVVRNDTVLVKQNENKLMPLASTIKILVAVEFAKQAGGGIINAESYVPISELNKYYLDGTDGGAHQNWLSYEKEKKLVKNDSVKLIDVARGMTIFSSNANTEFLMDLLGIENIKSNLTLFGLKDHTAIYPIVSSLFLYQNPHNSNEKKVLKAIGKLTEEKYGQAIMQIHNGLKNNPTLKSKFRPQDLTMNMQKMWSDRLTASTVKTYVQLGSIVNNRKFLSEKSYAVLSKLLEYFMESPGNQNVYKHFGIKGGSTAFVLTETFYATTLKGDRVEAAYFFNDLTEDESEKLQSWMNGIRIGLTQSEKFRTKLTGAIKE